MTRASTLAFLPVLALTALLPAQAPPQFLDVGTTALPREATVTEDVALGDLDGDGDLDLVLATIAGARLYRNDGRGNFRDETAALPVRLGQRTAVALGDVDGDGDRDIVLGAANAPDLLFVNLGGFAFADRSVNLPARAQGTQSLALADVDGDGDLDLFRGERVGEVRLLRNNGAGVFVLDPAAMPVSGQPVIREALVPVDLDRDGDLDLIGGDSIFVAGVRFYRNNGAGVFTDATAQVLAVAAGMDSRAVAVADYDGDGDLDIVTATSLGGGRLLRNDNGVFVDATIGRLPALGLTALAVVAGDFDEDGDQDLLFGMSSAFVAAPDRLLLNDGQGRFTDASASRLSAQPSVASTLAVGDLDGDGDLDVVVGTGVSTSGAPEQLYRNRHRDLQTVQQPVLGGGLGLRAIWRPGYGGGVGVVLPVLAEALAARPVMVPFGRVWIEPQGAVALPWLVVQPQSGVGTVVQPVPNDPVLVGLQVFGQALVLDLFGAVPGRLTGFTADVVR